MKCVKCGADIQKFVKLCKPCADDIWDRAQKAVVMRSGDAKEATVKTDWDAELAKLPRQND